MGRPEAPLPASTQDGLRLFAADLRQLRRSAGQPTYRVLGAKTGYAPSTLSEAAGGRRLPSLEVTRALVAACDGDIDEWSARWYRLSAPVEPQEPSQPREPVRSRVARYSVGLFRTRNRYAVLVVAAVILSLGATWELSRMHQAQASPELRAAEGADPHDTGCDQGRVDDLVPTGVYTANRIQVGTVLLRWSHRCGMAWARFEPTVAFDRLGGGTVTLETQRPADARVDRYQVTLPSGLPMWDNLMSGRSGCLVAAVTITFPDIGSWASAGVLPPAPASTKRSGGPAKHPLTLTAHTGCVVPG